MNNFRSLSALSLPLLVLLAHAAVADTLVYEYDELGRLTVVQYGDGSNVVYELDPAGNRTQVTTTLPPGAPASITVPSGSATGNYTIQWGTPNGSVTNYKLYEATNPSFSSQSLVYDGGGTSKSLTGRGDGTYYYRVRACDDSICGDYRTGSNAVSVVQAGVPSSINVPSGSSTGDFTVSWGTSSGTATTYRLYEAANSSFSGQVLVHNGAATSKLLQGRGNGNYYYRVRACNGNGCGGYRTGNNAVSVTLPPGAPASITVPSSSTTGNYTINWGGASGTVTAYKLYEDTNSSFSSPTLVYQGSASSKHLTGIDNGTYYYRVRACNGSACGGYRTGSNAVSVTLPPGTPASITVPSSSTTGSYTINWGIASGTVTAYKLYEDTNSSFSSPTLVYQGSASSKHLTGRDSGTYYYRVRACNGSACGGYRTGSNAVSVTLPPGTPASITVPSSSTTGNYTINWGGASGTVTAYKLYEDTNSSFSSPTLVYQGSASSKQLTGRDNGTFYYRVRACNGSACGSYRTGSNGLTVTLPPGTPTSISVSQINQPHYRVTWGASSGTVTNYQLYRSFYSSFSGQVLIYSGTNTSKFFPRPGSSTTYYFRVRACNSSGCSGYRASSGVTFTGGGGGGGGGGINNLASPDIEAAASSEPDRESQ